MHDLTPQELDRLRNLATAVSKSTEGYEYATVVIPHAHVVGITQELAEERQRFCTELHAYFDDSPGSPNGEFVPDLPIPASIRWWQSMEPARPETLEPTTALRGAANSEAALGALYDRAIEQTSDPRLASMLEQQRTHIQRAHHRLCALCDRLEQPAHASSPM